MLLDIPPGEFIRLRQDYAGQVRLRSSSYDVTTAAAAIIITLAGLFMCLLPSAGFRRQITLFDNFAVDKVFALVSGYIRIRNNNYCSTEEDHGLRSSFLKFIVF